MNHKGGSVTEETRRATTGRDPHDQDSYYMPERILAKSFRYTVHESGEIDNSDSETHLRETTATRRLTCES
jgi:hypothetical protein